MFLYRLIEYLNGETSKNKIRYLPLKLANRIKIYLIWHGLKDT